MTEQLIEKLQHLDAILRDVRQRYDITHSELNTLKATPQADPTEFEAVKQQLNNSQAAQLESSKEQETLQQKLVDLDDTYQTLAEAHHELNDKYSALNEQYNELVQKCEALEKSNLVLQEKNRVALKHTKTVMNRLQQIDQD